jgi:trimeric autotransporter adhesin
MRSRNLPASLCIVLVAALFGPHFSYGQYSISSVAGGGPNNLNALHASIGYAGSVARDAAGNTYVADSYSSQIFKIDTSSNLTVVAGNGTLGYSGDGGLATSAALNRPEGVVVDAAGDIFIADTDNSVIREVVAGTGNIQTVAGNGTSGYSGDGGPATSAELSDPFGLFVDGQGNIFIADTDNFVIREVLASGGNIQTVAGSGSAGYSGDGGVATSAQLDQPEGVSVDATGNIFIADTYNSVIREVTIANGNIQTVAGINYAWADVCYYSGDGGPAASAQLCLPNGVLVDGSGDIFIADTNNLVIREVSASNGNIQTVAGDNTLGAGYSGDGGPATSAQLNYPSGIVVDSSGNIFIADTENFVIREVTAGNIQTLVGNNNLAYSGDGGLATNAALNAPGEVSVDGAGDLFIADTDNSVVRELVALTGDIQTTAGTGIAGYTGDSGLATAAELNFPSGVFVDTSGNIFIADTQNSVIREVVAATGDIQTVAGNGTACQNFSQCGDGGAPTAAQLNNPAGVVLDASGNIYIADTGNSAIRVINTGSVAVTIAGILIQPGTIQTVAGNGTACTDTSAGCGDNAPATSAELNFPSGISLDAGGDIFAADTFDDAIREINATSGIIQTVAGTLGQRGYSGDNGPATSALLDTPYGVFVDALGNIFIADTDNSVVREVVAVTGTIQSIAGNGTYGFSGDGGAATSAELAHPLGLVGVASGNLFVADTENFRVRQLSSTVNGSVFPSSVTVPVNGPQQFASIVTGTPDTSVTWRVNNLTGGNSNLGTVSSEGFYKAPASPPASGSVTVTAISNANGFTSASAQVTIVSDNSPSVSISTTPSAVTEVYTGTSQTFNVTVTGETNSAVSWQVESIAAGNSAVGTISSAGLYSAPSTVSAPLLVSIKAVSQANPAVSGYYPFTIATAPSAPQPSPQTISPGGLANYSLFLNANTGDPKQPITLSCVQSTLPPGSSCAFSPRIITPATQTVPFTLTVSVPSGTASVKPAGLWLAPQICFGFMPLAGILLIGSKPRNRYPRWLWVVLLCVLLVALIACGGGSSSSGSGPGSSPTSPQNPELGTYNIQVQGTTTAQPNPVTVTTVGLTVH